MKHIKLDTVIMASALAAKLNKMTKRHGYSPLNITYTDIIEKCGTLDELRFFNFHIIGG